MMDSNDVNKKTNSIQQLILEIINKHRDDHILWLILLKMGNLLRVFRSNVGLIFVVRMFPNQYSRSAAIGFAHIGYIF